MPWPVDSGGPPHPRPIRMLRVGFVHVKTLAVRNNPISKLYQLFRTRGHPYGLQDSLSTLRLSCSPCDSSTDARLDTGRWLSLARRGLSPRKIRQAFPGAITFRVRGAAAAFFSTRWLAISYRRRRSDRDVPARLDLNRKLISLKERHTDEWHSFSLMHRYATSLAVPKHRALIDIKNALAAVRQKCSATLAPL